MFYDVFLSLCDVYETSPAEVRKALGISQSTMASWKSRGLTPNSGMLVRLSDYFGVSVEYLLGLEDMDKEPYDTYDSYNTFVSHKKDNDEKKEKQLLAAFNLLNLTGQNEAIKRVEELTEISKYQREKPENDGEAPSESKDTVQDK